MKDIKMMETTQQIPTQFEYMRDEENEWITEKKLDGQKKVVRTKWQYNGNLVIYEGNAYYFKTDNVFEVHPLGLKLPFTKQLILNPDGTDRIWLDLPYIEEFGEIPEGSTFYGGTAWGGKAPPFNDGRLAFNIYYGPIRELRVLFDLNTGELLDYIHSRF